MSTFAIVSTSILGSCALLPIIFNLVVGYYDATDERNKLPFFDGKDFTDYRACGTLILMFWPIALPIVGIVVGIGSGADAVFVRFPRWIAARGKANREAQSDRRKFEHMQEELRRSAVAAKAKPPAEGAYRTPPERCDECGRVK